MPLSESKPIYCKAKLVFLVLAFLLLYTLREEGFVAQFLQFYRDQQVTGSIFVSLAIFPLLFEIK